MSTRAYRILKVAKRPSFNLTENSWLYSLSESVDTSSTQITFNKDRLINEIEEAVSEQVKGCTHFHTVLSTFRYEEDVNNDCITIEQFKDVVEKILKEIPRYDTEITYITY